MKKIKKLISIKPDNIRDIIHFTHEEGVDTLEKDEIIDIELLNPSNYKKNLSDKTEIHQNRYILLFLSLLFSFINSGFVGIVLFALILISILGLYGAFYMYRKTINSRNILKIYSKKNVVFYKLIEEEQYKELYFQFNSLLEKYYPKEGELILYDENPNIKDTRYLLIVLEVYTTIICIGAIVNNGLSTFPVTFIIIASLGLINDFTYLKKSKKKYARYFYQNNFFKNVVKYVDGSEYILNEQISWFKLFKNNDRVALIEPRDSNPLEQIEKYEKLQGGIHHNLIFAEEYRDLTPILIEYFNDKSNEFFEKEKLTDAIEKIFNDEVDKQVELGVKNSMEEIQKHLTSEKTKENIEEIIKLSDQLELLNKLNSLDKLISSLIGEVPNWENEKPTEYNQWKFVIGEKEGYVNFVVGSNEIFEIIFDKDKIYPI